MQELIKPTLFNAQLIRSLGCTTYQGAEIGKCLAVANQIEPGNKENWYARWTAFADSNYSMAETYRRQGFHLDVKWAFLRACTYYRTAFFFWKINPLIRGLNKHYNTVFMLFIRLKMKCIKWCSRQHRMEINGFAIINHVEQSRGTCQTEQFF